MNHLLSPPVQKPTAEPRTVHPLSKPLSNSPHLRESQFRNPEKFGRIKSPFPPPLPPTLYTVPSYSHLACGSRRFFRVYLGVRTCELFLCFAPFVFLGSILFTSLFSLFTSPVSLTGSYTEVEPFFRRVKQELAEKSVCLRGLRPCLHGVGDPGLVG